MSRTQRLRGPVLLSLVLAMPCLAQTTTTGGLLGTVRDEHGKPVAGATVLATSSQITRTTVTGADGSYLLGLLNPGVWTLKVSRTSMTAPAQKVLVYTDTEITAHFRLASEATKEVAVVASAETIDVTSTSQGLQMTMEDVTGLPKPRDITDLAAFAPGVNADAMFGNPVINGSSGAENQYVLDGLVTNDFRTGFQGTKMKTDFIDQLDVQTGGFKPEYSALGGVVIVLTKSGSNQTKGSAWATWDPAGMQVAPIQTVWAKQGPADTRYDLGFEIGGPLVKDRLFYFVGVDRQRSQGETPSSNEDPGLRGSRPAIGELQAVAKLNAFLTPEAQFTLFLNRQRVRRDQDLAYPNFGTANLGATTVSTRTNLNLSFDWTLGPAFLLSAKVGWTDNDSELAPRDDASQVISDARYYLVGPGASQRPDLVGASWRTGGYGAFVRTSRGQNTQAKADLSWFVGTHSLKAGFSWLDARFTFRMLTAGPANPYSSDGHEALSYRIDRAGQLFVAENHEDNAFRSTYGAVYLQDTWEIGPGFKLAYGARQELQELREMDGRPFMKFSGSRYLQPRLGIIWDVERDSRTKVSASYGVYYESIPQMLNSARGNWVSVTRRYPATAYNYNNGNPVLTNPSAYNRIIDNGSLYSYPPVAEGTRLPRRKEFTAGIERTFVGGWTLGLHGKWRRLTDIIEDSVLTDADGNPYDSGAAIAFNAAGVPTAWGGQAILWNPGSYAAWTARNVPSSQNPGQRIVVDQSFFPEGGNLYRGFDLTATWKTARDYLHFSYTRSRLEGNYEGLVQNSNGMALPNENSGFDHWPWVGRGLLPLDRTHVVKLQASRRFSLFSSDLSLGCAYTYQSGTPLSRLDGSNDIWSSGGYSYTDGKQGNYGRTPAAHLLDLHMEWTWNLPGKVRIIPLVDVFNAFNSRKTTWSDPIAEYSPEDPNPSYRQPFEWMQGRRWRFGVKLLF